MRLLIVEDDKRIAENIKKYFENKAKIKNFVVDICFTGRDAVEQLEITTYDAIILDWMLPDISGIEVCKSIRQSNIATPIIMLTAKSQIDDKVEGFTSGADDYLTKPFSMEELLVRIQALIRRSSSETQSPILKVGDLEVNTNTCEVKKKSKLLELAPKEYALLEYLILNANKVMSRTELLDHVWGEEIDPLSNTVDVHIRYVRQKLGDTKGVLIKTLKNKGYMLCKS